MCLYKCMFTHTFIQTHLCAQMSYRIVAESLQLFCVASWYPEHFQCLHPCEMSHIPV